MIYLERTPGPVLRPFEKTLWYARVAAPQHARERVLPWGRAQVILNLARDYLMDCPEGEPARRTAPSLVVGPRSVYEIVDTADMADLIGIVFEPAGFPAFGGDAAHLFSNQSIDLEQVWGGAARSLRAELRSVAQSPAERLKMLEMWLEERFGGRLDCSPAHPAVQFTLRSFEEHPEWGLAEIARRTGWSQRRVATLFREQVGLSPKVWQRVHRFQRVLRRVHAGTELCLSQLAQECGFYDQAHFANEFRAFSGIKVSTYAEERTRWANHVPSD